MPTLSEIETALERGTLWAAMRNSRYWKLRRNGATQRWKTRPNDYRIPVKAGLKSCGQIWHHSAVTIGKGGNFVISESDPNS